ncbi:hypothetical protein Gpo141_00011227 [Globisporangium polare]
MQPTLSRVSSRSHVATDGAVPALQMAVDLLLPSHGQTGAPELDDGYLFDSLMDSGGDDDDDKRLVCLLMPHRRHLRDEFNDEPRTVASSAIQVLDISTSISAAAAINHTPGEPGDELGVIASVSPIRVSTASTPAVDHDPSRHCSYRKGKCTQPRTVKRNGSLHTLCAFHRERSCANQKAFDGKKRTGREPESAAKKTKKRPQKTANRSTKSHGKNVKSYEASTRLAKSDNKSKTKSRTQSKKVAPHKPAAAQHMPEWQRQARQAPDPTPSFTTDATECAKSREAEARENSKEQPLEMDDGEAQDERDLFLEFTRVLDGRQLSKAKRLALTQFMRDVLL